MEIDWVRVSVPGTAELAKLENLVEQQALAFQSMWGWSSHACTDYDSVRRSLLQRLHETAYRAASDSLVALFSFPEWDDARGCCTDLPELSQSWRVYPITGNRIYPPLWRLRANRTFLPAQLGPQVRAWRQWAEQAAGGVHDDYLRELHLHETTDFMHYHWSYLHDYATASLSESEDWARRPALAEVRQSIMGLNRPTVVSARIDPADKDPVESSLLESRGRLLFADLADLLELTRAWNVMVPPERQVPDYEENYDLAFEAFKNSARDPWLLDFLQWAECCAERGFALYLEY